MNINAQAGPFEIKIANGQVSADVGFAVTIGTTNTSLSGLSSLSMGLVLVGRVDAVLPIDAGAGERANLIISMADLGAFFVKPARPASVNITCSNCDEVITSIFNPLSKLPKGIIGILLMRPTVFITSLDKMLGNLERALIGGGGLLSGIKLPVIGSQLRQVLALPGEFISSFRSKVPFLFSSLRSHIASPLIVICMRLISW
jgi:hypothetical protein